MFQKVFIFKPNYSTCINAHCALDLLFYKIKVFTDTTAISVITNVTEPVSSFEKIAKLKRSNQYYRNLSEVLLFLPLEVQFHFNHHNFQLPFRETGLYNYPSVDLFLFSFVNDNVTKCVFLKK